MAGGIYSFERSSAVHKLKIAGLPILATNIITISKNVNLFGCQPENPMGSYELMGFYYSPDLIEVFYGLIEAKKAKGRL